jgi:hypothetical protein
VCFLVKLQLKGYFMITAMRLEKGKIGITDTTKIITTPVLIHCDADGDILIKWEDSTTTPVAFTIGEDRFLEAPGAVCTITSGQFTFANQV